MHPITAPIHRTVNPNLEPKIILRGCPSQNAPWVGHSKKVQNLSGRSGPDLQEDRLTSHVKRDVACLATRGRAGNDAARFSLCQLLDLWSMETEA